MSDYTLMYGPGNLSWKLYRSKNSAYKAEARTLEQLKELELILFQQASTPVSCDGLTSKECLEWRVLHAQLWDELERVQRAIEASERTKDWLDY